MLFIIFNIDTNRLATRLSFSRYYMCTVLNESTLNYLLFCPTGETPLTKLLMAFRALVVDVVTFEDSAVKFPPYACTA